MRGMAGCLPRGQVEHSGMPGVARAVAFDCPLSAMQEGYNTVRIGQVGGQAEQLIVWAELRLE
ncbi:MAG: hypothetical protein GWP08_07150 [Nitrospiraceae bacterium]|nr:hypothetical protein [Nitrospiraceae bacterium]